MSGDGNRDADNLAAPLDGLLVEAGRGLVRRFKPDGSTVALLHNLVRRPQATSGRLASLAGELGRIAAGSSTLTPAKGDRRFSDPAWSSNPFLRRLVQAYVATGQAAEELIDVAELDWRADRRNRFLLQNLVDAVAPTNFPLLNPASAKTAIDTGGRSLVDGAKAFVNDLREPPRIPQMVDNSQFEVGGNLAVSPGAVVFRNHVFELIQYTPATPTVYSTPLLCVPPTINKFYVADLAPGRSLIEHLVHSGLQVFMISWRNPSAEHAAWGLDTYAQSVIDALDAVEQVTGSRRVMIEAACSGGIIASIACAILAGRGELGRLTALTLLVTVIDSSKAGDVEALVDDEVINAAKAVSRRRGYLDGRELAEVFAWLRPNDLVWNYWVNNYLCGQSPPAFDILSWNSDTTRMAAQLHADFIDVAQGNLLVEPGALTVADVPIDLSKIDVDAYVVGGISDHITPWDSCYKTIGLLGGDSTFVLSRSGHIAAIVNPPTNPKATYQLNPANPRTAAEWLEAAATEQGSWWPHWVTWLAKHAGRKRKAPASLGGGGLEPLADAPGTYVFER